MDKKFIIKDGCQYFFCQIKDGKIVKKTAISKDVADLILLLKESVEYRENKND
jgi:hypothetical protein